MSVAVIEDGLDLLGGVRVLEQLVGDRADHPMTLIAPGQKLGRIQRDRQQDEEQCSAGQA
jgi:hypothetical protein